METIINQNNVDINRNDVDINRNDAHINQARITENGHHQDQDNLEA